MALTETLSKVLTIAGMDLRALADLMDTLPDQEAQDADQTKTERQQEE
jgi:hypothetical protein